MTIGLQNKRLGARVTIADVSDALGLTKSTVSRALNQYPDISETTRKRVQAMADKMGYRPLSHAQAIRTGLVKSLGLVIQMADHDAQRPFLAEFLAGLSEGASAAGFTLTIATSNSADQTLDTFRALIADHKADGFILQRTLVDDARITLLRQSQIPFVLFGRVPSHDDCASFDILGEAAIGGAVRHLVSLGHRRIGFINGGSQYTYAGQREAGYIAAMQDAGLSVAPDFMARDAFTLDAGEAAALAMLAPKIRPTAIICAVDVAALGAYRAAATLGLQVGQDLSIIGYDGIPEGAHLQPPLSTFAVNFKQAGQSLSSLLIRNIQGAPAGSLQQTAKAHFLDRGSVGRVPTD
ncbi:LacI family DNA-binding transcriptional regulator [Loktanella sp. S4079]|uniref:LacI family DNA-binding transcriptional regulator n=1 Tax=Loktanella sp. S4079 TaxID=579483 RepID=UPI000698BF52|nr:LacI family DNA-binding transcriptional regulator [Loktanella sp. S4079]